MMDELIVIGSTTQPLSYSNSIRFIATLIYLLISTQVAVNQRFYIQEEDGSFDSLLPLVFVRLTFVLCC